MEIRQLRHFVAAVEAGNFRKASENVHITHPALSLSIKNLESDLGVLLLRKSRKGIETTDAGEQFLSGARTILAELEDLKASLQGTVDAPTGTVRLGLPVSSNNAIAAPLFKLLLETAPGIVLEIEEGNSTHLLRSYENDLLDLMITFDWKVKVDYQCEPLYIEHLYLVSAYDESIKESPSISARSCSNLPIVSSPGTHSMRRTIEKYAFDNGLDFDYFRDFQSPLASLKIVETGLAHTFAAWDLIHDHIKGNLISAQKIENPPMERTVCLVSTLHGTRSAATNFVIDAIKKAIVIARANDTLRGRSFFDE